MTCSVKEKPKFCHNCGVALGETKLAGADDNDLGEESSGFVARLSIDALDFEFDKDSLKVKTQKIEDVMGTLDKVSDLNLPPRPKVSKKESRAQFEKEAGTLRQNKKSRRLEENG